MSSPTSSEAPSSGPRLVADNAGLVVKNLGKRFKKRPVVRNVSLTVQRGEAVALLGPNGAGKTTCFYMIIGLIAPDYGEIMLDGKPVNFRSPLEAREAGIETVFQNLALADDLDVPSNLFLGREKILVKLGPFSILDFKSMKSATEAALKKTAVKIPNLSNSIRNMSGGQRQCVAIARTATFASKLIIMDEPTAALGVQETLQVENIIRQLKANGEPLILISHNIHQ